MNNFIWPLRVYWEDTDAGGIVFYANYLKFFERARTEWFRSLGYSQQELKETLGCMFIVSSTQLKYAHPAVLDDELQVSAKVIESGGATLVIEQKATKISSSTKERIELCSGTIKIAWVQVGSLKPSRIPKDILQKLL
jgi:acyl-CoA thioester hydrolase